MNRLRRGYAIAATAALLASSSVVVAASPASAAVPVDRAAYTDKLRAMWLGEALANWTGLTTEGLRSTAPFFTDADWGTQLGDDRRIDYVVQDPWGADDDTDIEYAYLHAMANTYRDVRLTPEQISTTWQRHINRFIYVSNQRARTLMGEKALPPVTGMNVANTHSLRIDAQLTTEFFGALAPRMPEQALRLSELPIRTTADGYAAHASQFFVLLYSLASAVDTSAPRREQVVWLTREARRYLPNGSKSADVVDFVLTDFLANPDVDDWESTRDRIHQRYQVKADENGFVYRDWYESSVNLATGVLALLYGLGDFKRTVRIGTLSGWDSDNPTATLGGLLGLLYGTAELRAQFPDRALSDRYHSRRTRDAVPDFLPGDPAAEDTFTLMAQRMLPLVDQVVREARGGVAGGTWNIPDRAPAPAPGDLVSLAAANPLVDLYRRSANNQVRRAGGTVWANLEPAGSTDGGGVSYASAMADGREADFSGVEPSPHQARYVSARGTGGRQTFTVTYDRWVWVHTVRVIAGATAGLRSARVQLRGTDGVWRDAASGSVWSRPLEGRPYQQTDLQLDRAVTATGIRLVGDLGPNAYTTVAELDALSAPGAGATTVVEAESLLPTLRSTAPADRQENCCGVAWSADAQILFRADSVGDTFSLTFNAPRAGRYDLGITYTRAWDFGTQRTRLDDRDLGIFAHGLSGAGGVDTVRRDHGVVDLAAGAHTLSFEVTGKPTSSPRYGFGLDALDLRYLGPTD
ncbi:ADP-ribosylglycohydrolase family protein [Micromonospora sp. BQ11]|uniref:ADP-ribosylglycohydrolase family protein n=1 Tax=Micromonospora sp. BQ11 TaxID=3452212 RepID=UPI003F8C9FD9